MIALPQLAICLLLLVSPFVQIRSSVYLRFRYKRGKGVHRRPKRLPRGMLSWIVAVYRIKQEEVIEVAGYDAATYMRILTMGALVCRSPSVSLCCLRKH